MVSAGVSGTSYLDMRTDTELTASVKNNDSSTDFTKVLDSKTANDSFGEKNNSSNEDRNVINNQKNDIVNDFESDAVRNKIKKLFSDASVEVLDENEDVIEVIASQLMTFVNELITKLSDTMDISVEDVETKISELTFSNTDLLDKDNLSKLIMELNGSSNMMEVLTDSELTQSVKEIFTIADNIMEGIVNSKEISEDISGLFEKVNDIVNKDIVEESELHIDDVVYEDNVETKEIKAPDSESSSFESENSNSEAFGSTNGNENFFVNKGVKTQEIINDSVQATGIEQIVSNIEMALDNSTGIEQSAVSSRIISQVIDGITTNMNNETTTLELQLNPENLGRINISVTSKNGILTATITAQNEIAKEAIESQMTVLRENFENQGLKVEEVEVTLASRSFDQNLSDSNSSNNEQQSKSRKHISEEELDEINGVSRKEDVEVEEVIEELGNAVSVKA